MDRLPLSPRALVVLLVVPILALAAGVVTMGTAGAEKPEQGAVGDGCSQRTLRFGVTDDAAEMQRQRVFEARSTAVTPPGAYDRAVPPTATLHAASHGFVVLFYRPGLDATAIAGLRRIAAAGLATKAPVIVAPRAQRAAVVALAEGVQLSCASGSAPAVARARRFATGVYASLGRSS